MADTCTTCDVAIVGSGFAGSLIANELSKKRIKVVVLEAGPGVQPNINDFMASFYKASVKVPESPYPPNVADKNGQLVDVDPATVAAGRPTALTLSRSNWQDTRKAYLDQTTDPTRTTRPFKSTYERLAGGTSHWMGLTPRLVPNDFRMSMYRKDFPDWPITYDTVSPWYEKAEAELGVSADADEQRFAGITFSTPNYAYPMPRIPPSLFDQRVGVALAQLNEADTKFLETATPVTGLKVRSQPAARNSQPYRNRRACAGNTSCIPICPIQAKYDATITLNEATNKGAQLIDHAVASEILVENGSISGIKYIKYDEKSGSKVDCVIKAKIYVIAANGIETPRLLLMSRNQIAKGIANRSGMVGRNLMDHPQYLSWGLLPDPVFPYRGPLVTSAIGDLCDGAFRSQRAAFRISLGNDAWTATVGGSGGDPQVTTLDFINGMNVSGLNKKDFTQLAGDNRALFGADLTRTLGNLISRQFRIAFPIEQNPDPNNRVTLSSVKDALNLPRPRISYDISDYTKQGIVAAFRMKELMFRKLGAIDFTKVAESDPGKFNDPKVAQDLTYGGAGHVMGTYRMGDDPTTSVVDSSQRSHDHPNLYLVGSGTFPTVGTANPTLTLSALALRTAERIVDVLPSHQ
jgi:choline dehydrogenase-like flavoprotein